MREIVLDTETTGFSPAEGHRIVEIGGLEMVNHVPTGETYHVYINPERDIDEGAIAIHGITNDRVAGEPVFADLADEFLAFIGDSPLVIHNAPFDMGFINAELKRCGKEELPSNRAVDTLTMARKKIPGGQASLDALCRKFKIDNTHRELHGAMIDTNLLADVYIELIGGKQPGLTLSAETETAFNPQASGNMTPKAGDKTHEKRSFPASEDEQKAHQAFVESLTDPLWNRLKN